METNAKYKVLPASEGKFKLIVDGQTVKLARTDIAMETTNSGLLEKIGKELNPDEYRLEDGDIHDQYIATYFILSKVLMISMDNDEGFFSEDHYHWMTSSDPFFHLVAGPESIDQRAYLEFALKALEDAGGKYSDLPQLMAFSPEDIEELRNNPDNYIDRPTADIIRKSFLNLDNVRKGIFYHLWSATQWNVWLPLLWLEEHCSDQQFCEGVAATRSLIPAFGDVSQADYKEIIETDMGLLTECRDFIKQY